MIYLSNMVIFYSYVSLPEGISWYINSTVTPKQIINPRFCTNCYLECSSFKPRSHHSFYIDASMIPIKDRIYDMIRWISVSDYNMQFYIITHKISYIYNIKRNRSPPPSTTKCHLPPSPQTLAPVLSVAAPACARGNLRREPREVQRPDQLDEPSGSTRHLKYRKR